MRQRLRAAEAAELAELLEEAPRRAGVVDEVLQAAAEGRGMTLSLADPGGGAATRASGRAGRGPANAAIAGPGAAGRLPRHGRHRRRADPGRQQ